MPLTTFANLPFANNQFIKIELTCQKIDRSKANSEFHRTPPAIPNVYLDQENATLYFENACYECNLELVIPESDSPVYSAVIPDGADTFQLPDGFIGTYELHIHKGTFCFLGVIELQ